MLPCDYCHCLCYVDSICVFCPLHLLHLPLTHKCQCLPDSSRPRQVPYWPPVAVTLLDMGEECQSLQEKTQRIGASDRKPSWKQCASNFSWMWDFPSILLALRRLTRVLGAQGLCLWGTECHHVQAAPCLAGGLVFDKFSRPRVPSLCRLLYQLNNAWAVMSPHTSETLHSLRLERWQLFQ